MFGSQEIIAFTDLEWSSEDEPPQNENEAAIAEPADTLNHCDRYLPLKIITSYAPATAAASQQSLFTAMSLAAAKNKSAFVFWYTVIITFITEFEFSGGFNRDNIPVIWTLIQRKKLPPDWPQLTRRQWALVIAASTLPILWNTSSDDALFFFTANQTYKDYDASQYFDRNSFYGGVAVLGTCILINTTLSTGVEIARWVANHVAHTNPVLSLQRAAKKNTAPMPLMLLVGGLCTLSAFEEAMTIYTAHKENFEIEDGYPSYILFLFSLFSAIGSYSTEYPMCKEFLQSILRYLRKNQHDIPVMLYDLKKCLTDMPRLIAFFSSTGTALLLAYFLRVLYTEFNTKFAEDTKFTDDYSVADLPYMPQVLEILSWILVVQYTITGAASTFSLFYRCTNATLRLGTYFCDGLAYLSTALYQALCGIKKRTTDEIELEPLEENEVQPLLADSDDEEAATANLFNESLQGQHATFFTVANIAGPSHTSRHDQASLTDEEDEDSTPLSLFAIERSQTYFFSSTKTTQMAEQAPRPIPRAARLRCVVC